MFFVSERSIGLDIKRKPFGLSSAKQKTKTAVSDLISEKRNEGKKKYRPRIFAVHIFLVETVPRQLTTTNLAASAQRTAKHQFYTANLEHIHVCTPTLYFFLFFFFSPPCISESLKRVHVLSSSLAEKRPRTREHNIIIILSIIHEMRARLEYT